MFFSVYVCVIHKSAAKVQKKMTYTRVYGTFSLFYFDLRVLGKFFLYGFYHPSPHSDE